MLGLKLLTLCAALAAAKPFELAPALLDRRAYCNSDKDPGELITCGQGACKSVEANAATIVGPMRGALTDISAFVAVDPKMEAVVVAVRGTASIANTLTDLFLDLAHCPDIYPSDCYTHAGFLTAWKEIESTVLAAVSSAVSEHPGHTIVVSGHSLGGSVATMAAVSLRRSHGSADLYTYGSPRVGNEVFAEHVPASGDGGNYRITHDSDPVPLVPPAILGYRHLSPEYWFVGDTTAEDYGPQNATVCEGTLNFNCNAVTLWGKISLLAHTDYFQAVGGCDSKFRVEWSWDSLSGLLDAGAIGKVVKVDRVFAREVQAREKRGQ